MRKYPWIDMILEYNEIWCKVQNHNVEYVMYNDFIWYLNKIRKVARLDTELKFQ